VSAAEADLAKLLRVIRASRPLPDAQGGLLFACNFEGYAKTYRLVAPGSEPRRVADVGDRTVPHAQTELGLLVRHDRGGDERWQLSLVSPGGDVRSVTRDHLAIHQSVTLHPDRRRCGLGWNPGGRRDVALGELDLATGEVVAWVTPGDFWLWGDWSPDGRRAVVVKTFGSLSEAHLLERDGRLTRILPGARRVAQTRWTEAGVHLLTDAGDRDFMGLAVVDPERPREVATWLFAEDRDLEGYVVDNSQRRAALVVNEGIYDGLQVIDLSSGATLERVDLPAGVVISDHTGEQSYQLNWSPDDRSLVVAWERPTSPAEIYEWPGGRRWTAANATEQLAGLLEPVQLTYESFDGLPIRCLYYRVDERPRPAVVNFHGGPEGQSRGEYVPQVHFMNRTGVNVLRPNVRGSTGYGWRFQSLDDKTLRWDSVRDGCEAARHLKRTGMATRVAAMGGSYGGFMTLAVIVEDPELWDAAVDVVGIADWHTFFANMPPWRGVLRMQEYGDPNGAEAEFLTQASPLHKAHLIRTPLLIIHGRNDPRVPVTESEQIARAASAEILIFDDEGHGISRLANQVTANGRILAFLKEKLLAA
jgi:dipeptidyl aminopeptidase/acylaminoacyl peptidase